MRISEMKKGIYAGLLTSLIAFEASAAGYYVKNIEVSGLQRVEKETVLAYLNLEKNRNISQDELDNSFKNLYSHKGSPPVKLTVFISL